VDGIEELRERAELLASIQDAEESADWTNIQELRERAELLGSITATELGEAE